MNITLTTINSSYSHFGLAIAFLKTYLESSTKFKATNVEFTSEDAIEDILERLVATNPAVVSLSCYIWNIKTVHELTPLIKKILPKTVVVVGGPEVSYTPKDILQKNSSIDYVISGDGERSFANLITALSNKEGVSNIDGVTYRDGANIVVNKPDYINIDLIPSPYLHDNVPFSKPVVHYETSRGCIFRCAFCTSAIESKVREYLLDRVFKDLRTIAQKGVTYVNILDRSFAANKDRALKIMTFMRDELPHVNFHFEINPHLFDDRMFEFFKTLKGNRFQFEMGIQSTDRQTRENINISYSAEKTNDAILKLKEIGTVKLYLDLISGLPGESVEMFSKSFNTLMELEPETCQIETLKLLPGTPIREIAKARNYQFNEQAPYKILSSDEMSFSDITEIEKIRALVDKIYNKGWLKRTIRKLRCDNFRTYWDLFKELKNFWLEKGLFSIKLSQRATFIALREFIRTKEYKSAIPVFNFEAALHFKTGIEGMDEFKIDYPEDVKNRSFWVNTLKDNFNDLYHKKPFKYSTFYRFPFNPETHETKETTVLIIHPLQDGKVKTSKFFILY